MVINNNLEFRIMQGKRCCAVIYSMNLRDGYSFVVIFLISVTKRAGQMDHPAVEVRSIENCDKQDLDHDLDL